MFLHSVELFANHPLFDKIILIIRGGDEDYVQSLTGDQYRGKVFLAQGGAQRYESVYNGLQVLSKMSDCDMSDRVWIHDSARCCINHELLNRLFEAAPLHKAMTAAVPVTDTIKLSDKDNHVINTIDRSNLWSIQTPQVFEMRLLTTAYEKFLQSDFSRVTDDALVVEQFSDEKVLLVMGDYKNIKVTTKNDFETARLILSGTGL